MICKICEREIEKGMTLQGLEEYCIRCLIDNDIEIKVPKSQYEKIRLEKLENKMKK